MITAFVIVSGLVSLGALIQAMDLTDNRAAQIFVCLLWPGGLGVICADRMLLPDSRTKEGKE